MRVYDLRLGSSTSSRPLFVFLAPAAWGRPRGDGRQGKEGQRGGGDVPVPVYRGGGQVRRDGGRAAGQQSPAPSGPRGRESIVEGKTQAPDRERRERHKREDARVREQAQPYAVGVQRPMRVVVGLVLLVDDLVSVSAGTGERVFAEVLPGDLPQRNAGCGAYRGEPPRLILGVGSGHVLVVVGRDPVPECL